ncbi:MAG: hypothetical protein EWV81_12750 [Microcystis aeruginosa Ma_SC_T_19800800_S464]|uniref:Uncharacterized protein n=1 Tax=Microcystis aeruginosa Ma_SC_T_19800800_S464 TaxID=2486257 RepID=A0A552DS21_MICAE|nr:MAG: hypothetical protein EWV81_12750 [Microcystis aeruginosa Ma_SC_T_19800800_S464]
MGCGVWEVGSGEVGKWGSGGISTKTLKPQHPKPLNPYHPISRLLTPNPTNKLFAANLTYKQQYTVQLKHLLRPHLSNREFL